MTSYMDINQNLILLRGLPGAGKTSFAHLISEQGKYPVFSVDDYFTDMKGNYNFNFKENFLAYRWCVENTEKAILDKHQKIIVHNTFTMDWEMEPYFLLAQKHHCAIYVMTMENYNAYKNIHGVTKEQIMKMAEKYKVKLF